MTAGNNWIANAKLKAVQGSNLADTEKMSSVINDAHFDVND